MIVKNKQVIEGVEAHSDNNLEAEHHDVLEVQFLDGVPPGYTVGQAGCHFAGNTGAGGLYSRV